MQSECGPKARPIQNSHPMAEIGVLNVYLKNELDKLLLTIIALKTL